MATYRQLKTEDGKEIIELYLKQNLEEKGFKFLLSKEFSFKKKIKEIEIEISIFKDWFRYIDLDANIEKYESAILEIEVSFTAKHLKFNKWLDRLFNNTLGRGEIYSCRIATLSFMNDFMKGTLLPDEWKRKNEENAKKLLSEIDKHEQALTPLLTDLSNVLILPGFDDSNQRTIPYKTANDYDILLYQGKLIEALPLVQKAIDNTEAGFSYGLDPLVERESYIKNNL